MQAVREDLWYDLPVRILFTSLFAALLSVLSSVFAENLTGNIHILGNFVRLTLSHNPDIAFSIGLPYPFKEILIACALLAVLILAFRSKHSTFSSIAFGLIIGGAVANLIDRIPDGVVTDFIAVGGFPVFNIADACITIGAGMLLVESFVHKKD